MPSALRKESKDDLHSRKNVICDESVKGHCWVATKTDEFEAFSLASKIKNLINNNDDFKDLFHFSEPDDVDTEIELVANILSARGITEYDLESFISPKIKNTLPDPSIIKDMDKAVDVVYEQIISKGKIAIFGDYDVDGATSSSLLYLFLTKIGITSIVHIPDRIKEGYGPNRQAFKKLKDGGVDLVITVDCGTNAFEVIDYGNEIGLKTIIIDHHVSEVNLPKAEAIINPNRVDEDQDNIDCKNLAAVGVSFLFLIALNRKLRQEKYYENHNIIRPDLMEFLDIVALGTVCDVMQIKGLNRALVSQGLNVMQQQNNMGIYALSSVAGVDVEKKVSAYELGFVYGPRINAGGRVGKSRLGFELLTATDGKNAKEIADSLNEYNIERKEIEAMVLEEARAQALPQVESNDKSIVVYGDNWHEGVIGIVAGRLKEEFSVPTAVIAMGDNGSGKASARSVSGFDFGLFVHNIVNQGILIGGGGHAMAAGFSIAADNIAKLKQSLEDSLRNIDITPSTKIDAVIDAEAVSLSLIETIDLFAPYGVGNPKPKFVIKDVILTDLKILKEKHIKVRVQSSSRIGKQMDALIFNSVGGALGDALLRDSNNNNSLSSNRFNILGTLDINSWNGRVSPQIIIDDLAMV